MNNEILRIAIQKSGRLTEKSMQLLSDCGIQLQNGKRKLLSPATNFPLEIYYLRDDDIPQYVEDGVADIGILGENVLLEEQAKVDKILDLGFAQCRLSLAIPKNEVYTGLDYWQGKKIATTYSNILRQYLKEKHIEADIHSISGSVEIAPSIGLAEGICDLVSSGSTLLSNGLKEVEVILKSQAVLIANQNLSLGKQQILEQLLFRIRAKQAAAHNKYILLNAPNDRIEAICALLPGMKSPSILPLKDKNWSSLHSVVQEQAFWEVIDKLKAAGAEGILVIPIEKMIV
ncbi:MULTISPECIES: ATP phosphoribosyltransferase [unclassified Aureispira]|uniref:ATP phosphoribosyltransferase n=1 Tax=unclassified Aureispira TaxID=2649989 RepID=UPI0006975465|nr:MULTISPECIES: ATP phosphoribosyltransferase [unclassified Aureispira]WMX12907.1 ATP phosphoribosyltransferase [Aureispira sp. CCB-E]